MTAGIAYGAYLALFPGVNSTQCARGNNRDAATRRMPDPRASRCPRRTIYSEAFDIVQKDPNVSYLLGSPLKAYGVGGNRGRRNEMERWEMTEQNGDLVTVVRFSVGGPQGAGTIQTQVPRSRKRGEFNYIVFGFNRRYFSILDNRGKKEEDAVPPPPVQSGSSGKGESPAPETASAAPAA